MVPFANLKATCKQGQRNQELTYHEVDRDINKHALERVLVAAAAPVHAAESLRSHRHVAALIERCSGNYIHSDKQEKSHQPIQLEIHVLFVFVVIRVSSFFCGNTKCVRGPKGHSVSRCDYGQADVLRSHLTAAGCSHLKENEEKEEKKENEEKEEKERLGERGEGGED